MMTLVLTPFNTVNDLIVKIWQNAIHLKKETFLHYDRSNFLRIVDVIEVLTGSKNPQAYWRKLKQRIKEEGNESSR